MPSVRGPEQGTECLSLAALKSRVVRTREGTGSVDLSLSKQQLMPARCQARATIPSRGGPGVCMCLSPERNSVKPQKGRKATLSHVTRFPPFFSFLPLACISQDQEGNGNPCVLGTDMSPSHTAGGGLWFRFQQDDGIPSPSSAHLCIPLYSFGR